MNTFTWLHLTDMHVGQPNFGFDVALLIGKLVADLKMLVGKVGEHLRPDAILFTGDLAYSGQEYFSTEGASVESVLTSLLGQWPWPDRPKIASVPGNHDLAWQPFDLDQGVLWSSFHDTNRIVRDQFFTAINPRNQEEYWLCRKVTAAFSGYAKWLEQTALPKAPVERIGRLPGEYTATFETTGGARVGVLALNTAYYDLPVLRKERPKQLALHPDQLTALGFADWYQKNNICLALTHHPPSWIHEVSRMVLFQQYFLPDQIALHLCGHLHELEAARYSSGWDGTLIFQGRSLFGIEAHASGEVRASLGYTVGQLQFTPGATHATLRMYPRQASFEPGGQFLFKPDGPVNMDHHWAEMQVQVRPLPSAAPTRPPPPPKKSPSLEVLLEEVVDAVSKTLYEPTGQSVFLSGPPRYGKTIVVQAVEKRLEDGTLIVHRDLAQLSDTRRGLQEEITAFLLKGVAPIFGKPARAFDDLSACLGACLGDARCVLIIDNYQLITGSAKQKIANELRHCMEAYRPRFRLLLVSRRSLAEVAPVPRTTLEPSSFQTMLREIELRAIAIDEVEGWASAHASFRDRGALVAWMQRHTGGHPWLLSTLLQGLFDLDVGDWPTWTSARAGDAERARGLHAPDGPMSAVVQQLQQGVVAIARTLKAAKDPALGLCDPGGRVIPFVATCLGGTR